MKKIEHTAENRILYVQVIDLIALKADICIAVPLDIYIKTEAILRQFLKQPEIIYEYVSFNDVEAIRFFTSAQMRWILDESEFIKMTEEEKQAYQMFILSKCGHIKNKNILKTMRNLLNETIEEKDMLLLEKEPWEFVQTLAPILPFASYKERDSSSAYILKHRENVHYS